MDRYTLNGKDAVGLYIGEVSGAEYDLQPY